jgi:hypothetical protein
VHGNVAKIGLIRYFHYKGEYSNVLENIRINCTIRR